MHSSRVFPDWSSLRLRCLSLTSSPPISRLALSWGLTQSTLGTWEKQCLEGNYKQHPPGSALLYRLHWRTLIPSSPINPTDGRSPGSNDSDQMSQTIPLASGNQFKAKTNCWRRIQVPPEFICCSNSRYSSWATVLYIQLQITLRGGGLKMYSFLLSFVLFL